jgi:hypothetical protein
LLVIDVIHIGSDPAAAHRMGSLGITSPLGNISEQLQMALEVSGVKFLDFQKDVVGDEAALDISSRCIGHPRLA